GTEVHKIFGVVETAGVATVVRPPDLTHHLGDFGKLRENESRAFHGVDAGIWAGARGECSAHPDGTLVQMRQKFRADETSHCEIEHRHDQRAGARYPDLLVIETPFQCRAVGDDDAPR